MLVDRIKSYSFLEDVHIHELSDDHHLFHDTLYNGNDLGGGDTENGGFSFLNVDDRPLELSFKVFYLTFCVASRLFLWIPRHFHNQRATA
jgi:hypothetical protein